MTIELAQVRKHALSLADAAEAPHFDHASFRVRGRIFVTVPPEGTHVHVFVPDDVREPALAMHPQFVDKLHWGGKVVGVRIALADAEPAVVKALVTAAWQHKAPKPREPIKARK